MSDNNDTTLEADDSSATGKQTDNSSVWQEILGQFNRAVSDADYASAAERVKIKQAANLDTDTDTLVEHLIRDKCVRTGTVGAVTSGAAIIPGIGTATSLTLGVAADIGATFKLQAELVLEIAVARGRVLSEQEKRNVVMLVTGMSSGANQLLGQVGKRATVKITERYALKWVTHALPFVSIAASAATNVLSTYLVGKRANAYFTLGPETMGDWSETWRAITGIDERAIGSWFAENAHASWQAVQGGTNHASATVVGIGKATGSAIVSGASAAVKSAKGSLGAITKTRRATGGNSADAERATTRASGSTATRINRLLKRQKHVPMPKSNEDTETSELP